MPTYSYVARTRDGEQSVGVMTGRDANEVREMLRHKDLFLIKAQQRSTGKPQTSMFTMFRRSKVKLGDMVVASRQLASLVRAGLPIVECLHAVAAQTERQTLVEALQSVRLEVLTGSSLADAMAKHPKAFSEMYRS